MSAPATPPAAPAAWVHLGAAVRAGDTLIVALPPDAPLGRLEHVDQVLSAALPGVQVLCVAANGLAVVRPGEGS